VIGLIGLSGCILQASPDVLSLQVGKVLKDLGLACAPGEHFENVLYPDTHPADAWTTSALFGIKGDTLKVVHPTRIPPSNWEQNLRAIPYGWAYS
jgi:hypothetical protein